MNGEFLLDTNIVIRFFAHDPAVKRRFDANPDVLLPIFVLGELYYGAQKSTLVEENCEKIDKFHKSEKRRSASRRSSTTNPDSW